MLVFGHNICKSQVGYTEKMPRGVPTLGYRSSPTVWPKTHPFERFDEQQAWYRLDKELVRQITRQFAASGYYRKKGGSQNNGSSMEEKVRYIYSLTLSKAYHSFLFILYTFSYLLFIYVIYLVVGNIVLIVYVFKVFCFP